MADCSKNVHIIIMDFLHRAYNISNEIGLYHPANLSEFCPLQYLRAPSPTSSTGGLVQ